MLDLSNSPLRAIVDECDYERAAALTWRLTGAGYVATGRTTLLHRFIVNAPPRVHVDHRSGNKLDNRRSELRVASGQLNQANRHKRNRNNTSGFRGVGWMKETQRWRAQIMVNRKTLHLGLFDSAEIAHQARKEAELKYFGELCPDF